MSEVVETQKFTPVEHVMYGTMVCGSSVALLFGISAVIAGSAVMAGIAAFFIACVVGAVIARVTTWPDEPEAEPAPELSPQLDGRLTVPHNYFMPFCVCPKCDVEALHWMAEPDKEAAKKVVALYKARLEEAVAENSEYRSGWYSDANTPKRIFARVVFAGDYDAVRTCVECEYRWG